MARSNLRIGARGSPLSLAQTRQTRARLAAALGRNEDDFEIVPVTTSGDVIQDRRLLEAGGKGLFTKELDEALLDGRIDLAIHSMKDLPTKLPPRIAIGAVPLREDPRDAFISTKAKTLADLRPGAVVGTASLRRQAQVLAARPDLQVATLRGNVDTRLRKIEAGEFDATFLALAGLRRLGLERHAGALVELADMPPAAGQGALAITARSDDEETLLALQRIEDPMARLEIEAERAFLSALDGSCRTPIAALGRAGGGAMMFVGEALTPDGAGRWRRNETIALSGPGHAEAIALGDRLGRDIRAESGDQLVFDT
jgi:hydroxymethylbilane synthase